MNQPEVPNSRLFILGGKGKGEEDFREVFGAFGEIKDVWILKDKRTNEDKGVVYITYGKASMAALAREKMNAQPMPGQTVPLKVMIANNRKEGSVREPKEEEKNQRIFIKIPKSVTEKDVEEKFKEYGDVEYVNILREKSSGEPKGLAYVKYSRAYHAALAVENCDPSYKAIFAARKVPREAQPMDMELGPAPYHREERDRREHRMEMPVYNGGPPEAMATYPHDGETRLHVIVPSMVTQEQLFRLFDIIPGLEFCDLDVQSNIAYLKYSSPQSASYARDKLNGFEYPPSYRLSVRFARPRETSHARDRDYSINRSPHRSPPRVDRDGGIVANDLNQSMVNFMQAPNLQDNIQTLVEHIKKATSVLESAGVAPPMGGHPSSSTATRNGDSLVRVRYCSTPLPEKQPLLSRDAQVSERLFIVSQPDAFTEQILIDCFSRFGNLIDAYFMPGRNYGYAKYGCRDSAKRAIDTLHAQTVCGQRLKVMLADPPKYTDEQYEGSSKRPRS